jgi:HIRAN domain
MKRSSFIKSLGLGTGGLFLPKNTFVDEKPVKIYDNFIRGIAYYDFEIVKKKIKTGDNLQLRRESENMYDSFAIAIYFNDFKLGYIAAYENITLANMLDNGVDLKAFASQIEIKNPVFNSISVAVLCNLFLPCQKLIKSIEQDIRADDAMDIYRGTKKK